jgi:hypothetical protein
MYMVVQSAWRWKHRKQVCIKHNKLSLQVEKQNTIIGLAIQVTIQNK